jgi:2-oxoisovalerate dehydrogenase E1 component
LPGSPFGYRSKEEEVEWQSKDPLTVYVNSLVDEKLVTQKNNQNIRLTARASVEEAIGFCTADKMGKRYIPMDKWPPREDVVRYVRSEGNPADDFDYVERDNFSDFSEITYVDAIARVTLRNMERDQHMCVLGEEVANLHGGAYQATKGIKEVFPERLINTPISECGFVGMAGGAAANGMHPVVEIMFPDFTLVACDQLFNQIGKLKYMYGGQVSFPLLVRTRVAIGQGYGGQHSMSPAGLFGLFSGWRVIAPSNPFDYVGMFNTAAQLNDPVLIIEHGDLYNHKGSIPKDNMDYYVKYGRAKIVRTGSHVTLLTYLTGVNDALAAARRLESEGIDIEVIDLRTLDYTGMDFETIGESVKKTGNVIVLEQTPRSMGIASRVSDEIQERFFDYLDSPVQKITAPDVPLPVSRMLETALLPDVDRIVEGILRMGEI